MEKARPIAPVSNEESFSYPLPPYTETVMVDSTIEESTSNIHAFDSSGNGVSTSASTQSDLLTLEDEMTSPEIEVLDTDAREAQTIPKVFVGPTNTVPLHRFDLSLRIVQLFLIFWLLGGISMWITIDISILIKVCFNILYIPSFANVKYLLVMNTGFLVFFSYSIRLLRSLVRTYLRMVMAIWHYQMSFHSTISSPFYYPFHRMAEIFYFFMEKIQTFLDRSKTASQILLDRVKTACRLDKIQWYKKDPENITRLEACERLEKDIEEDDERQREFFIHKIAHFLIAFTLAILFGGPMIIVGGVYGFWVLVSFVTMIGCLLAAGLILIVNFIARINRCITFLARLHNIEDKCKPGPFCRASFLAMAGYELGRDAIRQNLFRWAFLFIVFLTPDPPVSTLHQFYYFVGFCFILLLYPLGVFSRAIQETYVVMSRKRRFYNGKHIWPIICIIATDTWMVGAGVVFLGYYDSQKIIGRNDGGKAPTGTLGSGNYIYKEPDGTFDNNKGVYVFAGIFVLRMLLAVVGAGSSLFSTRSLWYRYVAYALCSLTLLILSVCLRIWTTGFSAALMLLVAYTSFDFREPKYLWSSYQLLRDRTIAVSQERFYITIKTIVQLGLFFGLIASFFAGIMPNSQLFFGQSDTVSPYDYYKSSTLSPLCSLRIRNLSVADYAELSDLVNYSTDWHSWDWDHFLDTSYSRWGRKGFSQRYLKQFKVEHGIRHISIHLSEATGSNLTIIAVRGLGSFSKSDVMQDLYLYSASILLKLSSYFGTLIHAWPVEYVADLFQLIQGLAGESETSRGLVYADEVMKAAESWIKKGRDVVITGHSTGAAISGIVAARLKIPGIGFSGPGLGYQSKHSNFSLDGLMANYLNIVPAHDPVASLDEQIGLIQHISCYEAFPLLCHFLEYTQRRLDRMCSEETSFL